MCVCECMCGIVRRKTQVCVRFKKNCRRTRDMCERRRKKIDSTWEQGVLWWMCGGSVVVDVWGFPNSVWSATPVLGGRGERTARVTVRIVCHRMYAGFVWLKRERVSAHKVRVACVKDTAKDNAKASHFDNKTHEWRCMTGEKPWIWALEDVTGIRICGHNYRKTIQQVFESIIAVKSQNKCVKGSGVEIARCRIIPSIFHPWETVAVIIL